MAQGPVTVRDSVSPITFPRAKSTLLASSLISYLNLQKEGTAQRILSKLPAWTSHWGGHGYSASALSTQQDGTSLLPSKLNMMRHLLWLMRCEQKPHRSPPGEAGRIHGCPFSFFFLISWKIKKGVTHPEPAKENLISSQNGELVVLQRALPKPTSENVIYLFPGSKGN